MCYEGNSQHTVSRAEKAAEHCTLKETILAAKTVLQR